MNKNAGRGHKESHKPIPMLRRGTQFVLSGINVSLFAKHRQQLNIKSTSRCHETRFTYV